MSMRSRRQRPCSHAAQVTIGALLKDWKDCSTGRPPIPSGVGGCFSKGPRASTRAVAGSSTVPMTSRSDGASLRKTVMHPARTSRRQTGVEPTVEIRGGRVKTVRRTAWTLIAVLALMASSGCGRTGTVPWTVRRADRAAPPVSRSNKRRNDCIDRRSDRRVDHTGGHVVGLNKRHEVSIEGSCARQRSRSRDHRARGRLGGQSATSSLTQSVHPSPDEAAAGDRGGRRAAGLVGERLRHFDGGAEGARLDPERCARGSLRAVARRISLMSFVFVQLRGADAVPLLDPVARAGVTGSQTAEQRQGVRRRRPRFGVVHDEQLSVRPTTPSFSRRSSRSPTSGCHIRTAAPLGARTSCRAQSRRNASLPSESSPTSRTTEGSSTSGPIEARKAATIPAICRSQSGYRAVAAGSRNIVRSRFSPARIPGSSSVARAFAARTSKARSSTNAGRPTTSRNCSVPVGTRPRPRVDRCARAVGRTQARASRYAVAASSSPNTLATASSTWGDGFRSRPCSSRR